MSDSNYTHGQFCWTELTTPDVGKAKSFYADLFGWEAKEHDMGNGMIYNILNAGGKDMGGMVTPPEGQPIPPNWMSYIYVNDIGATLEKAQSLGATVRLPVTQAGEMGQMAIIEDPTGAVVPFWESNS